MNEEKLGRLIKVDLRDFWFSESGDFTPWLAQEKNIALLGETIGLELEVEAQEKSVGPFRADILCKDVSTDQWVLVENQLERTDHTHLGQLLTYGAGLNAVTIVWIAARFTEEHRAALDWLNEITDERFNFFGLEVELWRIGESLAAPKFNVISKPNVWTRTITGAAKMAQQGDLSKGKQLQLDFWSGFKDHLSSTDTSIVPTKPLPQNWMNIQLGRYGTKLLAIASLDELRAEVQFFENDATVFFTLLQQQQKPIEEEMGEPLNWYNPDTIKSCRIFLQRPADLHNHEQWPEYFQWLQEKLERLQRVFRDRVRQLDLSEYHEEQEEA